MNAVPPLLTRGRRRALDFAFGAPQNDEAGPFWTVWGARQVRISVTPDDQGLVCARLHIDLGAGESRICFAPLASPADLDHVMALARLGADGSVTELGSQIHPPPTSTLAEERGRAPCGPQRP